MDSSKKLSFQNWSAKRLPLKEQNVNFPLMLAPMVGLSHGPFRQICQDYLGDQFVALWPTEMLNSRKIPREKVGATAETLRTFGELRKSQALAPQILGNEEIFIKDTIRILNEWGATAIDINMGCPVDKALKHNYGVALMGDADYAGKVVKMAVQASHLPVSVKLRAVEQGNAETLISFVNNLINNGASWITLHPRTAEQKRRGSADWNQIKWLKERVSIPLIGNGDVQTSGDVITMLEQTSCDYVMLGRAATARPWIFRQVAEDFDLLDRLAPRTPSEEAQEYGRMLIKLLSVMEQQFRPEIVLRKFRFFVKTSCVWLDYGHALYSLVMTGDDIEKMKHNLCLFFTQKLSMSARTDLRQ